jgi:hypothetical protein
MPKPPQFREEDKIKMLLWCARYCCLCGRNAGPDIEIAHISKKDGNNIDNGIPLCYDCHAKIGHYNLQHPRGNKYKPEELKARREQVYEEHTRNLVPPLHFYLNQRKIDGTEHKLPFVGFHLQHLGDSLPVKIRVEAKIIIGGEDLGIVPDASGYYNGTVKWNINPRILFWGGFGIPQNYFERAQREELKIEVRVTVIDQFEREHRLLPQCWRWATDQTPPFWNLEPRSFTEWT